MKGSYKQLLKNSEYLKFLCAKTISRFGDSLDVVAYGMLVFEITGSMALMAALYAVNTIPNFLLSVFSGAAVSYFPKRLVIIVCDYGRGFTVILTALLFFAGTLDVWMLFAFTAINSTFESFRGPAGGSLYQSILKPEEIAHASALDETVCNIAELAGFTAAAVLIMLISIPGAIIVDGITFIICGTIIFTIRHKEVLLPKPADLKAYFADITDGIRYFKRNKLVLSICLYAVLFGLFTAPVNAMLVPYAKEVIGGDAIAISMISSGYLAFTILGTMVTPLIMSRIGLFRCFVLGAAGAGLGYAAMGGVNVFGGVVVVQLIAGTLSMGMLGFFAPMIMIPINTVFVRDVAPEYMARVGAVFNTMAMGSVPLGAGLSAVLIMFLSLQWVFALCGLSLFVLGVSQLLNPTLRKMDKAVELAKAN